MTDRLRLKIADCKKTKNPTSTQHSPHAFQLQFFLQITNPEKEQ